MPPQPLDYRSLPKPRVSKDTKWGPAPNDPESRRWRFLRGLLRVGIYLLFVPVAVYFLPNLLTFGKLTRRTLSDFIPVVQSQDVPIVRAIKQYKRDTGHWPQTVKKLIPKYITVSTRQQWNVNIIPDWQVVWFYNQLDESVQYNLDPLHEGWLVKGYFVNGPLPVPLVNLSPVIHP